MPLFRDASQPLAAQPLVVGGSLALGTDALDADFAAGVQVVLGRALGDWYRLEYAGWMAYSWSDTAAVQNANESASIRNSSKLDGQELSLRRRWQMPQDVLYSSEFSTLVGARHLRVDETLDYQARLGGVAAPTTSSAASVDTDNDLWGVQLGALAQFLVHDRAWIDVEIKGGIFTDAAQVDSTYAASQAATQTFQGDEYRTVFMGDLSVVFDYQFAPAWTFRAGYHALWLTGLALASQNTPTVATAPWLDLVHSGQAVYHGPSIGLVWAH
jgi:hypothetical protein